MKDDIQTFDVVVIGAGPGGYVSAIRAAQLGLTVCCIDDWVTDGKPAPGGLAPMSGAFPRRLFLRAAVSLKKSETKLPSTGFMLKNPRLMFRR